MRPKDLLKIICLLTLPACGGSGADGVVGPAGASGTMGMDGAFRVYGDGSAGATVITADATLADVNTQYTDFTVSSGKTLYVSSGTVIHCSGTFTNNGTIQVIGSTTGWAAYDQTWVVEEGLASTPAWSGHGRDLDNTQIRYGNPGGTKMPVSEPPVLLRPPLRVGGAGGAGALCSFSASGGGSLVLIAKQGIVNAGTIQANGGETGCGNGAGNGGAGGGIVVLASSTSIVNSGSVQARGGNGQSSDTHNGPGGGGGGGIIHLLSPTITAGTLSVPGGMPGPQAAAIPALNTRVGGSGGGASAGDGGAGGQVNINGTFGAAVVGGAGVVFQTLADPTALLL